MSSISIDEYLAPCCQIARAAGELIMGYFNGEFQTRSKGIEGPVTDADIAANRYIVEALSKLTPMLPIIAEESDNSAGAEGMFWLVDPLDGTRSFVRREKEFTVNIALIEYHAPILGVLYSPPLDALYYAQKNKGAFRSLPGTEPEKITARKAPEEGLVIVRSQSHPSARTEKFLNTLHIQKTIGMSSAIKFAQIAEGSADLYPRFGRTMEWDTAAGHIIVDEAGGRVETEDGEELLYGKPGFENPGFVVYGK